MYCTCGKQSKGYTAMPLEGDFQFCYDLWVCANCLKPSKPVFEGITHMYAPARATAVTSVYAAETGIITTRWSTEVSGEKIETCVYKPYPRKVDMDQGRNILLETWHKLDESINLIRTPEPTTDVEGMKQRAHAFTEVIVLMMPSFYASTEDVLRESMTRWTARQEGRDHESPGLAERIWNPNTRFDGTPYSEENERRVRAGGKSKTTKRVELDDQKITFIKHCIENNSMTPEVLAGMFGCSVEQINEVAAS